MWILIHTIGNEHNIFLPIYLITLFLPMNWLLDHYNEVVFLLELEQSKACDRMNTFLQKALEAMSSGLMD